ncbi:MAG: hypothetical protein U5L45_16240 [Saprospiraceae bacterium]|nr:hypothetical protein [Saprospiraceae bacterium]
MASFSASPKNEPHSLPLRERSERKAQKSLWSYAHPSVKIQVFFVLKILTGIIFRDNFNS